MADKDTMTGQGVQTCTVSPVSMCGSAPKHTCATSIDVTTPADEEKIQESAKRSWFEAGVNKALKIPTGYIKVAVLVLRWEEYCDDYASNHTKEVERLKDLFSGRLGYSYKEVKLGTEKNPQHTLRSAIGNHIEEHDGPNNLLIVLYTGHGIVRSSDRRLQLAGKPEKKRVQDNRFYATAYWDKAEEPLLEGSMEADVLAILDCCFASAANKGQSNERRIYELIAACDVDELTPEPGPNSFTSAFIQSMEKLLTRDSSGSFTTMDLLHEMSGRRPWPRLWNRLHQNGDRHVRLAHLNRSRAQDKEKRLQKMPLEKASLTLRFSLKNDNASEDQLTKLGELLPGVFKAAGMPVRWIEWWKMENTSPFRSLVETLLMNRHKHDEGVLRMPSTAPETRKRRQEVVLCPPAKRTREGSASDEVENSGLCTPPRISPRPRLAVDDR